MSSKTTTKITKEINELDDYQNNSGFQYSSRKQRYTNPDRMIKRLDSKKLPYKLRKGSECTEILLYDTLFVFTSTKNFPQKKLFLFNLVKRNVQKYIMENGSVKLPEVNLSTRYNLDYAYETSIGIDLNHAYWRIAYVKGFINKKTYEYGLDPDCKAIRLATLSVLGREKKFIEINTDKPKEYIVQKFDKTLNDVFKYIRLECFYMMNSLAKKLGDQFDCWKTDCIYFNDTPENRLLVTNYFNQKNMTYKVLDFFESN
jgi:hypothetical protein